MNKYQRGSMGLFGWCDGAAYFPVLGRLTDLDSCYINSPRIGTPVET